MQMLRYFLSKPWRNTSAIHNTVFSYPPPHTNTQRPRFPSPALPGSPGMHYADRAFSIQHSYEANSLSFHTFIPLKCIHTLTVLLKRLEIKVIPNTKSILISCNVHSEQCGVWHWSLSHEWACWIRQLRFKLCQHYRILVRMEAHKISSGPRSRIALFWDCPKYC